jgi:thioredoxin 1
MALHNTNTRADFDKKVLESDKLVLVDFWAQWCPPCRMMAPVLEAVSKSMDKDLDVVKVDIEASDDNRMLAGEYGVQGIPNMQVFKNGKVVDELVGMRPQAVLEDELKAALKK